MTTRDVIDTICGDRFCFLHRAQASSHESFSLHYYDRHQLEQNHIQCAFLFDQNNTTTLKTAWVCIYIHSRTVAFPTMAVGMGKERMRKIQVFFSCILGSLGPLCKRPCSLTLMSRKAPVVAIFLIIFPKRYVNDTQAHSCSNWLGSQVICRDYSHGCVTPRSPRY